jgi:hypothetical protein
MTTDRELTVEPSGSDRVWQAIPVVALAVAVLSFLVNEICDLDIWWHIAIGRDILGTGAVPAIDRYAVAALGRPYHDSHWLFQVAVAFMYRISGWVGVQAVMVGLWSGTLALCHRAARAWTGPTAASIFIFLAAMASVERFLPRPELVTYLGVAAFYFLLQQSRFRSARDLALLAFIQIVWSNCHGLFVIGPFLVACYWLVSVAKRFRGERGDDFVALTRALGVVVLATLATPFGYRGWWYAGVLFLESGGGGPQVIKLLGELSPTFGEAARSSPAFWFYLALVCLTAPAIAGAIARRRLSARSLIVAALFAVSLTGRRNIVLFVIVAAPLLAESLSTLSMPVRGRTPRWMNAFVATMMLCYAWYPLSGAFYLQMELPSRTGLGVTPSFFPHGLPRFLARTGFRGTVLNSNTLGGFQLFHGYPDRRPLTDGRWEVYDPDTLVRVVSGSRSRGRWREVARTCDAKGLLLAHTSPEAAAILSDLREPSGWRLVYLDQAASFWVREGDFPAAASLNMTLRDNLPVPGRADDGLILNVFLTKLGLVDFRILNLQRTLLFPGVRRDSLLEQLGPLLIEVGRMPEASEALQTLLAMKPDSELALNELAYLSWAAGNREQAISLMERLLKVAPRNEAYRENYERLLGEGGAVPGDGRTSARHE